MSKSLTATVDSYDIPDIVNDNGYNLSVDFYCGVGDIAGIRWAVVVRIET